jgi:hypothetical protein
MQNDFLEGKPNYLSLEGTNEVETTKIDNLQKFFFFSKTFCPEDISASRSWHDESTQIFENVSF